jgi:site-specific recombinase
MSNTTASSSAISRALVAEIQRRIAPELIALGAAARAEGEGVPALEPLRSLVKRMRNLRPRQRTAAVEAVCNVLESDAELRAGAQAYAARLAISARTSAALADLGLLPAHGFFAELRQRISARILPSHRPPHDLTEILQSVFDPIDARWLETIDDAQLTRLLALFTPDDERATRTPAAGALRAIDLLAHRLAAAGEDPVLFDFDPEAMDHESPFLAQAEQVLRVAAAQRARLGLESASSEIATDEGDVRHAHVLLTQCREAVTRIRRRVPKTGATIRLTYELERIEDLVERLTLLLDTLASDRDAAVASRTKLFRRLVLAQGEIEQVLPLLSRGSKLVTSEIVSHAGRTGEHYIARTPSEYGGMWMAAGGAGLIVAFLACIKVGLAALAAPPLVEAALFSANYAIGFVIVQLLGMTIATKQPAMTAAALAGSIDAARPKDTRSLVETIQCLVRSQLAAIGGNCLVALPAALALSTLFAMVFGHPVASIVKAHHLVEELDPLHSLAIPHAAITGLWLTLSGVVAGYASAWVMARHVPERIRRSVGVRRTIGPVNARRLAGFVESKSGAVMGSIVLGTLLGSTGMVGHLLGLPIDIRHVSFASANLGLAIATLGPEHVNLGLTLAGIAGIGATNLIVSFSLSLGLALHARHEHIRDLPGLARDLLRSAVRELPSWMLPVGASATPAKAEG